MRRVGDREPLAGDGVAEKVFVLSAVGGRRGEEDEAITRIDDAFGGMGGQEAEGRICVGLIIIISYWEVMGGSRSSERSLHLDEESRERRFGFGVEDDGGNQTVPSFGHRFESGLGLWGKSRDDLHQYIIVNALAIFSIFVVMCYLRRIHEKT